MRIPEDYYFIDSTDKKYRGVGCSVFLILFIIAVIVIVCATRYSAPESPLGEWLDEMGQEFKVTLTGICVATGIAIVSAIVSIVMNIRKK